MRRWVLLAAAFAVLSWASPIRGIDVGELEPVGLVRVRCDGRIVLETDTGAAGKGRSLEEAAKNLEETAEGKVFLDTADYAVVSENYKEKLSELLELVRPGTEICILDGSGDCEELARFLSAHSPGTTLWEAVQQGKRVPVLIREEGRFRFAEEGKR